MITATLVLVVLALVFTAAAGAGKAPLWIAVLLLALVELLRLVPAS